MASHQSSEDPARNLPRPADRRWRRSSTHQLTPSERRVLNEALRGGTTRDIARALFVTEATVRTHLTRIYEKAGVRGRTELLANWLVTPVLAPVNVAVAPSVPAFDARAALSDYVWTSLYVAVLLAANGILTYLTPLSALTGPTIIAARATFARNGAVSRRVLLALLTTGVLLSAEQIAVLVALRTL